MTRPALAAIAALGFLTAGCVVWIREPSAYAEEVAEVVQAIEKPATACYDAHLEEAQARIEREERAAQGPYADIGPAVTSRVGALAGSVVLEVVVAPKTGIVAAGVVDAKRTTAPKEVVACVADAVRGLRLGPADRREGRVRLRVDLRVGKHRPAVAASAVSPKS